MCVRGEGFGGPAGATAPARPRMRTMVYTSSSSWHGATWHPGTIIVEGSKHASADVQMIPRLSPQSHLVQGVGLRV